MAELVVNPDFRDRKEGESTATGWFEKPDRNTFEYAIEAIQLGGVTRSIQKVIGSGRGDGYIWQKIDVTPGTYRLSGTLKTQGEISSQLRLFFMDENEKIIRREISRTVLGNSDWERISVVCESPPEAKKALLFAISYTVFEEASCSWSHISLQPITDSTDETTGTTGSEAAELEDVGVSRPGVVSSTDEAPVIIPRPQRISWDTSVAFRLSPAVVIVPEGDMFLEEIQRVAEYFSVFVKTELGMDIRVATSDQATVLMETILLRIGSPREHQGADKDTQEILRTRAESYCLEIERNRVTITGHDARGLFFGVQSFIQIINGLQNSSQNELQTTGKTEQYYLPGCVIVDYPDLEWRAVHIFIDFLSQDFTKALIDKILCRYKFNALVIECSSVKWESHPEIWRESAVETDKLRDLVDYAKRRFMEVIPLVQSLGHCQWLFANGQNVDICEDRDNPYAYNPLNDRSYSVMFEIYDEAIEVFRPKLFHIGHDEVRMVGSFPKSAQGKEKGFESLFVQDTNRISQHLESRGVRPMMWADIIQEPTFQPYLSKIDSSLFMVDWQYTPFRAYQGIEFLRNEGFDVIGSAWHNPQNIFYFTKHVKEIDGLGMLQTTWTGHFGSTCALATDMKQYIAHLYAAEMNWNVDGYGSVAALPYDSQKLVKTALEENTVTGEIPDWGRNW
ncbi:family 20 glycosylhydrolase [Alicyclobacillus sp. SO9]|uniref:family 20 glycosylhydrolase n=1 Tax=Alicyclobacillus sp. SO9 TaxID=2665646 RepID=UPI0018E8940E|nr:family 20 glycosylhydrolase [Alicyclobacillus sp. SO9]QQE80556.1 family 20 glycosylhydrolase [Alicyclobacillus sp. SO9]